MKNLIWIIIIIVITGGALYFFGSQKDQVQVTEQETNTLAEVEQEMPMEKFALTGTGTYTVDTAASSAEWKTKKTFVATWIDKGNIALKEGSITVEEGAVTKVSVVIDMNSIETKVTGSGNGQSSLTNHLKSADFFDVEKFPTAEFALTSITATEVKNSFMATGDFTIKGITKSINFPAMIYMEGGRLVVNTDLVIDRSQFDVQFGSQSFFKDLGDKAIDDNFTLKVNLVANMAEVAEETTEVVE